MNLESTPEWVFRILFLIAFLLIGTIAGRYRKRAQAGEKFDLTKEPPWMRYGLRGTALLMLAYFATYLVWPPAVAWSRIDLPAWLRLAGGVYPLFVMPWLLRWTQNALGDNVSTTVITRAHHELITTGPYRWVRHPLYVLGMLFYASLSLILASWFLMAGLLLGVLLLLLRTPKEEQMLHERFGASYEAYRERTGMFLPRLFRGTNS